MLILSKTCKWFLGVSWTTTFPHCFLFEWLYSFLNQIFLKVITSIFYVYLHRKISSWQIYHKIVCVSHPCTYGFREPLTKQKTKNHEFGRKMGWRQYIHIYTTPHTQHPCVFSDVHKTCVYTHTHMHTQFWGVRSSTENWGQNHQHTTELSTALSRYLCAKASSDRTSWDLHNFPLCCQALDRQQG